MSEITEANQTVAADPAPEKEAKAEKPKKNPASELRAIKRELKQKQKELDELNEELRISVSKNEHLFEELRRHKARLEEIQENNAVAKQILFEGINHALKAFNNSK